MHPPQRRGRNGRRARGCSRAGRADVAADGGDRNHTGRDQDAALNAGLVKPHHSESGFITNNPSLEEQAE